MMSELLDMLSSVSFWRTWLIVSAVPYGMFLVAFVLEGRRPGSGPNDVPVYKGQSRAFMPGGFGLALFVTVGVYYIDRVIAPWSSSLWFVFGAAVLGNFVFFGARRFLYTEKDYSKAAWNSPSKKYHDYVMFLMFTVTATLICVPVYFATSWDGLVLSKLLGVFGLCVWIVGNVFDFTYPDTIDKKRQHPDMYQPIWRRNQRFARPMR